MTVAEGEPAAGLPATGSSLLLEAEHGKGGVRGTGRQRGRPRRTRAPGERPGFALLFLIPALVLLAAILLYPLIYSVIRSLFSDTPTGAVKSFTGLSNYGNIFTDPRSLQAVKNNIYWVVIVPTVVTILGLIFAVLSERIRWATVFKTVLFMPMAISFLASGVTFVLIYADQPSRGLANTVTVGIHDIFGSGSAYPGEHPRDNSVFASSGAGYTTKATVSPGTPALLPLTGLDLQSPPKNLKQAALPSGAKGLSGAVWNDFKLGGGGKVGQI